MYTMLALLQHLIGADTAAKIYTFSAYHNTLAFLWQIIFAIVQSAK